MPIAAERKLLGYGEGFYGPPHSWEDRHYIVDVLASEGLNAYVYAPKNDPYHRDRWREPYPVEELDQFRHLKQKAESQGVSFCFSISPMGMVFSSEDDFALLQEKIRPFLDMGISDMAVLFDDVPEVLLVQDEGKFKSLGQAHGATGAKIFEFISVHGARLAIAPTEYTGNYITPYLQDLAAELPSEVPIAWTGLYVLSPEITAEQVAEREASLQHPILVWDNFPVNDGPMGVWCHLGPWQGRDWRLIQSAAGLFVNGMQQARASMVGLRQLGQLIRDKEDYDPMSAWVRACLETGRGAPEAFRIVAEQMSDSVCQPIPSPTLWNLLDELEIASDEHVDDLRSRIVSELERQSKALAEVRKCLEDKSLLKELDPWLDQMGRNLTAMYTLAKAWEAAKPERSSGIMTPQHMFSVIAAILQRTQPGGTGKVVHGASLGFRAVVETVGDGWRVHPGAIVENRSAVDRFFALVLKRVCRDRDSEIQGTD